MESSETDVTPSPLVGLGGSVIQVKTTRSERVWTVHTDLICNNSLYFKLVIQPRRKPMQGACPICHVDFILEIEPLVYCRLGCKQNIHLKCFEEWRNTCVFEERELACPYCRGKWVEEKTFDTVTVDTYPDALDVYLAWLYSGGHFALDKMNFEIGTGTDMTIHLFKLLLLAQAVMDCKFRYDVMKIFLNENVGYQDEHAISWLYENSPKGSTVVRGFIVNINLNWAGENRDRWREMMTQCPHQFLVDIILAMSDIAAPAGRSPAEFLRVYHPDVCFSARRELPRSPTIPENLPAQQLRDLEADGEYRLLNEEFPFQAVLDEAIRQVRRWELNRQVEPIESPNIPENLAAQQLRNSESDGESPFQAAVHEESDEEAPFQTSLDEEQRQLRRLAVYPQTESSESSFPYSEQSPLERSPSLQGHQ